MSKPITVSVYETIGSQYCVASSDGQRIFDRIVSAFTEELDICLSFKNVTSLTSAFLNAAIGQLYGRYEVKIIQKLLTIVDIDPTDLSLLRRVVENAKLYFEDPLRFESIVTETNEALANGS